MSVQRKTLWTGFNTFSKTSRESYDKQWTIFCRWERLMSQQIKPDRKVWKIDITTLVCKSFLQMQCCVWCEQACRIRNALWVPLLSVKNRKNNYNGSLNIWKLGKIHTWAGKYCSICVYSSFISWMHPVRSQKHYRLWNNDGMFLTDN